MQLDLRETFLTLDRSAAEAAIAEKTRFVPLANNRIMCSILGGRKFFVLSDDMALSPHLLFEGYWEFWLSKCFAQHIMPGDVVLDLGANLGYYSLLAADLVGPEGQVYAYEPAPNLFSCLEKSLAINGMSERSTLVRAAVAGPKDVGRKQFYMPDTAPMNARFPSGIDDPDDLAANGTYYDVDVITLDATAFEKVDFVKIDVEGAERQVLEGMADLLAQHRPKVVCEVKFLRDGYDFDTIVDLLGENGQLMHLDYDSEIKPLTREMAETERLMGDWLVCAGF